MFFSEPKGKRRKFEDSTLNNFVAASENCRRLTLVRGLGGSDHLVGSERCCDVCTPSAISPSDRLNVLEIGKSVRHKKRVAVRYVSDELVSNLKTELRAARSRYLRENPSFNMVGPEFVCPDVTIDELCSQATYIDTVKDITIFGIKPELKERFFNVISSILSKPNTWKRRRT